MTISKQQLTQVIPADSIPGPRQGQWTYAHYATLPDDGNRYEVIDGVLYMAPASPFEPHQSAANLVATYLTIHIQFTGLGRVYAAPFDVELAPNTVVQPDVLVILHSGTPRRTASHIIGAPDLVVEIASPATKKYDRQQKRAAYARAGVREYWLVEPEQRTIEVLVLEGETYHSRGIFSGKQNLPTTLVSELPVMVEQFFE